MSSVISNIAGLLTFIKNFSKTDFPSKFPIWFDFSINESLRNQPYKYIYIF